MYAECLHGVLQLTDVDRVRVILIEKEERSLYFFFLLTRKKLRHTIYFAKNSLTLVDWQVELVGQATVDILVHTRERDIITIIQLILKALLILQLFFKWLLVQTFDCYSTFEGIQQVL